MKRIPTLSNFGWGDFTIQNIMDEFDCSYQKARSTVSLLRNAGEVQVLFTSNRPRRGVLHFVFIHEDPNLSLKSLCLAWWDPVIYIKTMRRSTDNDDSPSTIKGLPKESDDK